MTEDQYVALVAFVRERARGCCGDDSWRGRFCQYHQGFIDGADEAATILIELEGSDRGG